MISKLLCLPRLDIRRIVVYAAADKAAPKIATKANQEKASKAKWIYHNHYSYKDRKEAISQPL